MRLGAKQHLKRYLEMGLAVLLVLAALFVPQGWFLLRDGALAGRVQGETLSPLIVAQLDNSYEQDIQERMSACLAAINSQDVMCSSKEIDPGSESLWENIGQAQKNMLLEALNWSVVRLMDEREGWQPDIESCMQYALMRKSDGQILLVANDIRLDKGDGSHMELLLDGVDGTIYYLESQKDHVGYSWHEWIDNRALRCWEWRQILNDVYCAEKTDIVDIEGYGTENGVWVFHGQEINSEMPAYDAYDGLINLNELTEKELEDLERQAVLCATEDGCVKTWFYAVHGSSHAYTYCCLLAFGEAADSWTMEVETWDQREFQRVQLGLPWVVRAIPEMADRISMTEYDDIYRMEG